MRTVLLKAPKKIKWIGNVGCTSCYVLTNGAVFSMEACAGAVTVVVFCTETHTHTSVLTRIIATGIHWKRQKYIYFA